MEQQFEESDSRQVARRITFKEPVNAWTHFLSLIAAIFASLYLLTQTWASGPKFWSMLVYSIGFMGVFFASSVYHFYDLGPRWNRWLKRLDHSAIFVMIAGSYVPILVHYLAGAWRTNMLLAVGSVATLGILFKLFWIHAPSWLGVAMYLSMGWMVVVAGPVLFPVLPDNVMFWLVVGGLVYSVGAVVYALKWPDMWPERFGHHELWHLFVMGGAAAHYVVMLLLLPVPVPA